MNTKIQKNFGISKLTKQDKINIYNYHKKGSIDSANYFIFSKYYLVLHY